MNVHWKFPKKKFTILKIEKVALFFMSLFIFFIILAQLKNVFYALLFSIVYVGVYFLVSYFIQLVRLVEEEYHFTPTQLEITRKTRFRVKTERVPLKKVSHHKLDHFFLGGYIVSEQGKHLLFFNTKKELQDLESFLKKHL